MGGVNRRVDRGFVAVHRHQQTLVVADRRVPMRVDSVMAVASMTKPVTGVAMMMLYEEGRFQLDEPISKFIPAFKNPRVYAGGSRGKIDSVPAEREITFRDLLTHTSGLTYGFMESTPVDAVYRDQKIDFGTATASLAEVVERLAAVPLIAQPGKAWNYSVATDVLGYLVQVISGQPFDVFLREKVLKPLRMLDTDFIVAKDKQERFATCYMPGKDGKLAVMDDPTKSTYLAPRNGYSGGGGLAGTAGDYLRFCKFMLNKGELDGVRLLGRKTVELMTSNHLPGDMADMGMPRFSESPYYGIGFGLGFSVMINPAKAQILGTAGGWKHLAPHWTDTSLVVYGDNFMRFEAFRDFYVPGQPYLDGVRINIVPDLAVAEAQVAPSARAHIESKLADAWDANVEAHFDGANLKIVARGKAAHGSTPYLGDSAITRAFRILFEIAPVADRQYYEDLLMLTHPGGVALGLLGYDDETGDLTSNLGVASVVGVDANLQYSIRAPFTWANEDMRRTADAALIKLSCGARVSAWDFSKGLYFPLDHPLVKTICEVYKEETDEDRAPGVMGGGTYARAIPNCVSIGTGWDGDGEAHQTDERLKVEHLFKMARIYAHILYRLATE